MFFGITRRVLLINPCDFRLRVIGLASQMCNDITGPTGLLGFIFTAAEWAAIPGISVTNAAGVVVIEPIFDIVTPIVQPNAGAAAGTVKFYELARTDRSEVKKGISILKSLLIESLASDDISELSDLTYGMMLVTCQAILTHAARKYGTLNQEDFETIHSQLQVPKSPTIDYSSYAEIHRNYHRLLLGAGQPCSEFAKTTHYMNGLKDDLQGREAVKIYVHLHPLVADRNFADLVATVILIYTHQSTLLPRLPWAIPTPFPPQHPSPLLLPLRWTNLLFRNLSPSTRRIFQPYANRMAFCLLLSHQKFGHCSTAGFMATSIAITVPAVK